MVIVFVAIFVIGILLYTDTDIKFQTMGMFLLMSVFLGVLGVPHLSKFIKVNKLEIEIMILLLLFPINLNLLNVFIKAKKKI